MTSKVRKLGAGSYEYEGYTIGYYQGDTEAFLGGWEIREPGGDLVQVFSTKRACVQFLRETPE